MTGDHNHFGRGLESMFKLLTSHVCIVWKSDKCTVETSNCGPFFIRSCHVKIALQRPPSCAATRCCPICYLSATLPTKYTVASKRVVTNFKQKNAWNRMHMWLSTMKMLFINMMSLTWVACSKWLINTDVESRNNRLQNAFRKRRIVGLLPYVIFLEAVNRLQIGHSHSIFKRHSLTRSGAIVASGDRKWNPKCVELS